jgi:hypothetical protein
VQRATRAAGGFLDIIHDRINAELKVAKTTGVTVETSHKYLGQAADYAADTGSQLSILVVLDMTKTKNPPGVLENYLGFMTPALAGLDDPRFPSLVEVIIIKGSLSPARTLRTAQTVTAESSSERPGAARPRHRPPPGPGSRTQREMPGACGRRRLCSTPWKFPQTGEVSLECVFKSPLGHSPMHISGRRTRSNLLLTAAAA